MSQAHISQRSAHVSVPLRQQRTNGAECSTASPRDAQRGYSTDQREPGGDRERGLESRNEAGRGPQMTVRSEDRTRQRDPKDRTEPLEGAVDASGLAHVFDCDRADHRGRSRR